MADSHTHKPVVMMSQDLFELVRDFVRAVAYVPLCQSLETIKRSDAAERWLIANAQARMICTEAAWPYEDHRLSKEQTDG